MGETKVKNAIMIPEDYTQTQKTNKEKQPLKPQVRDPGPDRNRPEQHQSCAVQAGDPVEQIHMIGVNLHRPAEQKQPSQQLGTNQKKIGKMDVGGEHKYSNAKQTETEVFL